MHTTVSTIGGDASPRRQRARRGQTWAVKPLPPRVALASNSQKSLEFMGGFWWAGTKSNCRHKDFQSLPGKATLDAIGQNRRESRLFQATATVPNGRLR